MRKRILVAVAGLLAMLGAITVAAPPASAQTVLTLGWVLDFHGSTACYMQANHLWCDSYPNWSGTVNKRTWDHWVPTTGCDLGTISLTSGSTGNYPARLTYWPYNGAHRCDATAFTPGGAGFGSWGSTRGSSSCSGGRDYVGIESGPWTSPYNDVYHYTFVNYDTQYFYPYGCGVPMHIDIYGWT